MHPRCFGVLEPDYYGAIDVSTGRSVLYQPRLDENYAIIMGHIPTPEEVKLYLVIVEIVKIFFFKIQIFFIIYKTTKFQCYLR